LGRNRWAATVAPVDHAVAKPFSIKPFLKRFAIKQNRALVDYA
jgi:hypothetical protein